MKLRGTFMIVVIFSKLLSKMKGIKQNAVIIFVLLQIHTNKKTSILIFRDAAILIHVK